MDIIIVGCGKVGSSLASVLSTTEHNITVIDIKESRINEIVNGYDVMGITGSCRIPVFLRKLMLIRPEYLLQLRIRTR